MSRRKRRAAQALVAGREPKNPVVIRARSADSIPARVLGVALAGTGAAHFTAPRAFDGLTAKAFPRETRQWTYRNGATELLLGLAIVYRRTRVLGSVGLFAYTAWLCGQLARRR